MRLQGRCPAREGFAISGTQSQNALLAVGNAGGKVLLFFNDGTPLTANLEAQERLHEAQSIISTLRKQVDESTAKKYAFFLRESQIGSVEQLLTKAEQAVEFQNTLIALIDRQLKNYANAYPEQFGEVDISDDLAASEAAMQ